MGRGEKSKGQLRIADPSSGKSWILLGLLAATVAFAGGASRFDAIQIVPLRALCALFFGFSLYFLTKEKLKSELGLTLLFGCFAMIVVLQLAPLPSLLWQNLPQRGEISQLDAALGLEGVWRPWTLAPVRTWNALGSLVVPLAGLALAIALGVSSSMLLRIIAGLGVLNASFGLLQLVGGGASVLYIYEITSRGSPVGILANENHAAFFAACSMLVVTFLGLRVRKGAGHSWERLIYPVAFFLILFVLLVGGSRAGFLAAIGAIFASMAMLVLAPNNRQGRPKSYFVNRWLDRRPGLILVVPAILVSLAMASFLVLDRAPAYQDLLERDNLEDLRWSLWPVIASVLKDYWIAGAGFGSFEQVYHIYEPPALLMRSYVNQAHNDWAQFVIEGGLLAGLVGVGLLVWLARRVAAIASNRALRADAVFWMSIFAVVGAASVIDYPLRTPLFQLVTVWLLVALSRDARNARDGEGG